MVIEVSDYYKEKGYVKAYLAIDKQPRRVCTLRMSDGTMTSISYAKYLYTSHYKCDINNGDQIDHVNGNPMDDRIENLQVISKRYNIQKDHKRKEMIVRVCPVCGENFLFEKRNLNSHPNPCCSRRCGGIKSHWTKNLTVKTANIEDSTLVESTDISVHVGSSPAVTTKKNKL